MEKRTRKRIPLWLRIAIGVTAAIFALIAAGVALRFWITSDAGRAFIVSQIDGRRVGPLGTIRVSGLKGDPLQAATLADLALVDDDGVWLRARDARIEWTPEKLFGGELEIQAVHIRTVDMLRLPHTTAESENKPPPDIGLKLDQIAVDEFRVADTVVKPNASYRITGGAARTRAGAGFARLGVTPITGPADRVDISAEWSADAALKGHVAIGGPPGGLVALFAQAPEGKSVTLNGDLSGTLKQYAGAARLAFDGEPVASVDVSRNGDVARLASTIAPYKWPLLDPIAHRTGAIVKLDGQARLADPNHAPLTLAVDAPGGHVDIAAVADLDALRLTDRPHVAAKNVDLAIAAPPLAGKLDAAGELDVKDLPDFEWTGEATAVNLSWPSGAASKVSTQFTIGKAGASIYWEAPGAIVDGGRIAPLKSLAPARYSATSRGEVNLRTHVVDLIQAQVRGAAGDVSARGMYTIGTGAFEYAGSASLARLSDVAPLTGSARGQWTVKRASQSAPIRLTADASGRDVSSHMATLAELVGPSPAVKLTGVVREGRFTVESGAIHGEGVSATMAGRITDAGAITAHASGGLTRALALPGARIAALEFTADMSGGLSAPQADIRLANGAINIAGLDIGHVGGEGALRFGDTTSGSFSLRGGAGSQALLMAGRIDAANGDWRVSGLNARVGGVQLSAPQLAYANGAVSAAFSADGDLAGFGGLDRGTLAAQGKLTLGDDLKLDITGQFANLRSGTVKLDLISFDAKAANNQAALKAHVKGLAGAPVDLTLNATGRHTGDDWSGDAMLDGVVDQLPVAAARPAAWRFGATGWAIDASLAALGGQLDANLASLNSSASARLDLVNLDLGALSRLARISPLVGKVSGRATFSNGSAPATGDLQLDLTDANPLGVTADKVSVHLESRLRDAVLVWKANGAGQGFKLDASSTLPMHVGSGFDLTPNRTAPIDASVTMDGRAEQLWALFGPEGQALRGAVNADVRIAGTLNQPALTGGFEMRDGVYEHGETGLRLQAIAAKGVFDQRSARLTELSASDSQGGALTGSGALDWDSGASGSIKLIATNLRALGRDDRSAIVSGKGAVTLDKEAIHVTGEFEVARARVSIEQPASASVPLIPGIRRVNFKDREDDDAIPYVVPPWLRPIQLDMQVKAPRRVVVFGRGLDTEWSADLHVQGSIANPIVHGAATLVRGALDLAGRRFDFDTGTIDLDGPIRAARIDISARRTAQDIDATVHVTGTPDNPKFTLESTPALPQDEILARILFGRSASQLSAFEAAQLAAGLAQLAGGQAGFDPAGLVRKATGLDRVAIGGEGGIASVSAGKYVADNVYVQVGAGGEGGVGAQVEWQPRQNLSITSSAQGNGDTKIAVRWKRDY